MLPAPEEPAAGYLSAQMGQRRWPSGGLGYTQAPPLPELLLASFSARPVGYGSGHCDFTLKYEPNRQQNYRLRPGKGHLLRQERRPGITYGPQGEAEWLLRHAYPAD